MVMITHDRIGTQIDGEDRTQQFDTVHDPLTAVIKVKAGMGIFTTQEGSPYAAGDAVVVGRVV